MLRSPTAVKITRDTSLLDLGYKHLLVIATEMFRATRFWLQVCFKISNGFVESSDLLSRRPYPFLIWSSALPCWFTGRVWADLVNRVSDHHTGECIVKLFVEQTNGSICNPTVGKTTSTIINSRKIQVPWRRPLFISVYHICRTDIGLYYAFNCTSDQSYRLYSFRRGVSQYFIWSAKELNSNVHHHRPYRFVVE